MKLDFSERNPQRNPMFLHPVLLDAMEEIMEKVNAAIGPDHYVKILSTLRTPDEQFQLFRIGREIELERNTVTSLDGINRLSNHNYQPSQACDFGIFTRKNGKEEYVGKSDLYLKIGPAVKEAGFRWGGDFNSFFDGPHFEIRPSQLFGNNRKKGSAIVWQTYLSMAGTYTGAMDGLFGPISEAALEAATGSRERNRTTYKQLFERFGRLRAQDVNPGVMGLAA